METVGQGSLSGAPCISVGISVKIMHKRNTAPLSKYHYRVQEIYTIKSKFTGQKTLPFLRIQVVKIF